LGFGGYARQLERFALLASGRLRWCATIDLPSLLVSFQICLAREIFRTVGSRKRRILFLHDGGSGRYAQSYSNGTQANLCSRSRSRLTNCGSAHGKAFFCTNTVRCGSGIRSDSAEFHSTSFRVKQRTDREVCRRASEGADYAAFWKTGPTYSQNRASTRCRRRIPRCRSSGTMLIAGSIATIGRATTQKRQSWRRSAHWNFWRSICG
jgi:hypothetical protein